MSWLESHKKRRPLTRDQLLGIANYLTYSRIAIVPVIVGVLMGIDDADPEKLRLNLILSWLSMLLIVLGGISDVVDGHYARKYGITSSFGKFLDPLADKLLSMSVLIMLLKLGRIEAWIVILLIARDVTVTALRAMASDEGFEMAASEWGKKKQFILMIALGFLLVHYPAAGLNLRAIGTVLMGITLVVSLASGVHYVWVFFSEALARQKQKS